MSLPVKNEIYYTACVEKFTETLLFQALSKTTLGITTETKRRISFVNVARSLLHQKRNSKIAKAKGISGNVTFNGHNCCLATKVLSRA